MIGVHISKPLNILVVDDDKGTESLFTARFGKRIQTGELNFFFASNARQALECLAAHPDEIMIALLDIRMPEIDGLTLLNQLHEQYPRLCVIMMTAYGDSESMHAAQDGGAHDFIVKPTDFAVLYLKLRKAARYVQECRHHEQVYQLLAEKCREGLAVVRDGNVLFANQGLCRLLDTFAGKMDETPLDELLGAPEPQIEKPEQQPAEPVWQVRHLTRGGQDRWFETAEEPVVWHGSPAALVTVRTITAARRRIQRLERENLLLRGIVCEPHRFGDLIGRSAVMQKVFENIRQVALTDHTVLIVGETGSGKELAARTIHQLSERVKHPFVAVNCGTLKESLAESTLFGYRKGAFTGADAAKPGLFEAAHQGTLFLDEVGELSPAVQVKFLRVLDDRQFFPVGGTTAKQVDVRIIAAANQDLSTLVREGAMRADLFHRLHACVIEMPPLRERKEDIPLLVEHFLEQYGMPERTLPEDVLTQFYDRHWPGNVRELQQVLRRYLTMGKVIFADLPAAESGLRVLGEGEEPIGPLRETMGTFEKQYLIRALARYGGNRTATATALGIDLRTLQRRLKTYRIT